VRVVDEEAPSIAGRLHAAWPQRHHHQPVIAVITAVGDIKDAPEICLEAAAA